MTRKIDNIKLSDFPEEVTETCGVRASFISETSMDNQLAVLSHFLHSNEPLSEENRREIITAVLDFLESKKEKGDKTEYTEEYASRVAEDPAQYGLFERFFNVPFPSPQNPTFTFIDLFAGMGGFRLAMQAQGGKCVFSSEWNKYSQTTYFANFGEMPFGDITKEGTKSYIPKKFDILCAGFPCQPFSIAGVSKKKSLGRETGFKDKTQGTLFFDVADIISRHRPKAFFLENEHKAA